jgi:hypothetical protein
MSPDIQDLPMCYNVTGFLFWQLIFIGFFGIIKTAFFIIPLYKPRTACLRIGVIF